MNSTVEAVIGLVVFVVLVLVVAALPFALARLVIAWRNRKPPEVYVDSVKQYERR